MLLVTHPQKFYWNGLKMINTHRLRVAQIRLRVEEGGDPMSRAEYRFIRTYKEDVLKCVHISCPFKTKRMTWCIVICRLIPFLIIVVIAEEVIPIIAIYAPFMMPSTTIFPSQLQRIEDKARDKQVSFADNRVLFAKVVQIGQGRGKGKEMVHLSELRAAGGAKAVCGILRLATWGPPPLRLWRLDRYLRHIAEDDVLLAKEDWGAKLADKDVLKALNERGM
jgi:LETM1 and EF-hand domain-containing protein 1